MAQRMITVLAVVLLGAFGWGGAAWAQSSVPSVPSVPVVVPGSSTTSSSTSVTTTSSAPLGLPGLGGLFPTGTTGLPSIPGLPAIDPSASPTVACAQVVSALRGLDPTQLSAALDSPAAIFCDSLGFQLPSLPGADQGGTAVETTFPTTSTSDDSYDDGYGRRYYGSCGCTTEATPVYATQVSSVPTGGVNTGDGSYGP